MSNPLDVQPDATPTPKVLAPASQESPFIPPDKTIISPLDNEVCLTWYSPSIDVIQTQQTDSQPYTQTQAILGYAANKRTKRETACGFISVPLSALYDLHDRYGILHERGRTVISNINSDPYWEFLSPDCL